MNRQDYNALKRQLTGLKPTNARGFVSFMFESAFTAFAIWLSLRPNAGAWVAGQILFAIAMWQWFVILHSCGHHTYFRAVWLNDAVGHVASVFTQIPYFPWRHIHAKHHTWAGWQDLDPTTQGSLNKEIVPERVKRLMDFAWKYWLPLFSVYYVVQTFWNLPKVNEISVMPRRRKKNAFSMAFVIVVYLALIVAFRQSFLRVWPVATVLMLTLSDPILLSQHVHIPLNVAGADKVRPYKHFEQDVFSRSVECPSWMSRYFFLHFNMHSLHHVFPDVPHYHLAKIEFRPTHRVGLFAWLREAKRVPARRLLFESILDTQAPVGNLEVYGEQGRLPAVADATGTRSLRA
jgi:omega-6 fatty acid desaturase (delta-12 desaturase)